MIMTHAEVPDDTPVVVGTGLVSQHTEDALAAREPIELMLDAVREAGRESGSEDNLRHVGKISIPKGRWRYGDPGRLIADRIGATGAKTQIGAVGVLQQTLIGEACRDISTGAQKAVLVVGGEAGYRILRAKKAGVELTETEAEGMPDTVVKPKAPLRSEAELAAGLNMPVGLYAMLDSSLRTARGQTMAERLESIGQLYEGFAQVAAGNPEAWMRRAPSAEDINTPAPDNRLQALPYTKLHCSNWSVDQASALLVMSAGLARELGIAPETWVYALGSSESNHMETVTSRRELHRSPGAKAAGTALLDGAGKAVEDIDLLDLYSCFPVAVDMVADELGISRDRPLTITGARQSSSSRPTASSRPTPYKRAQIRKLTREDAMNILAVTEVIIGLAARQAAQHIEDPGAREKL